MRRTMLLAAATIALAGCDLIPGPASPGGGDAPADTPATPAGAGAFAHSQSADLSGYYRPASQVGPGDFQLMHLFIGQAQEFRDWEAGQRSTTFAPVMLDFLVPGEQTERVLPDSYSISDGRVRMTGESRDFGRVTLDGQLDQGGLSTARRNLGGGEAPVLTAVVTVGGQTFSGVKLAWYGGD